MRDRTASPGQFGFAAWLWGKHGGNPFVRASSDSTCRVERGPRVQLRYSGAAGIAGPATRGGLRADFMASPFRSVMDYGAHSESPLRALRSRARIRVLRRPTPSSPRRSGGLSFCVRGYQGPRGVSSAAGRQPALGPPFLPGRSRHPTLSTREPDRAGAGPDWNQSLASGDCLRVGPMIDPGLNGSAYGHLGPPPILQLTSDRAVSSPP